VALCAARVAGSDVRFPPSKQSFRRPPVNPQNCRSLPRRKALSYTPHVWPKLVDAQASHPQPPPPSRLALPGAAALAARRVERGAAVRVPRAALSHRLGDRGGEAGGVEGSCRPLLLRQPPLASASSPFAPFGKLKEENGEELIRSDARP
jgi:hypothetical protein